MPANYVLLEKITVGAAGASSVTFSGIPQTGYTDLVVKVSARTARADLIDGFQISFNGNTTSYARLELYNEGGSVGSESVADRRIGVINSNTSTSNTFGSAEIYIPNYTSSNYKSLSTDSITENNATYTAMWLTANLWSNTAAITSIALSPSTANNWVQYSTFYLYGVAKLGTTPAIVPYATGGDTIMTDGTYWYHAFKSSGTFTPTKGLSVDYLVVAGGAGGGKFYGGGGGAGGYRTSTGYSCASGTGLTVTIGAGGAGASSNGNGTSGSNSVFDTITSTGGGYGAGTNAGTNVQGGTGGSGGGSGGYISGTTTGGLGTAGQGNNGGAGSTSGGGAGGGGAGAVGGTATGAAGAGAGGAGLNTLSTWFSATGTGVSGYVAGGGGGSGTNAPAGGAGGGGTGASDAAAGTAGTENTGSGGGGGSGGQVGQKGGSGLVIVRYAV